ncbi:MAG: ABC transporter substrate-binding protein [Actinomycetota bacterium]|nr:ABC transporter substrate-binding protein [Actinomycetota bacterium]
MSRRILLTITAIALVAAACGSSTDTAEPPSTTLGTTTTVAVTTTIAASSTTSSSTTSSSTTMPEETGFPVTIDAPNGPVTIETQPESIVSLSPTSTEVLFAVGAGPQVVAVDNQSNYPIDAPMTELTGFEPNLEAIAAYGADLVVIMYDPGDVITGLEAIGIPVIMHPSAITLNDAYVQIEQIGAATGHHEDAMALVASMKAEIGDVSASTDGGGATYYHELSPDYYSVTSATFVGSLYTMLGLSNIADGADPDGYGYPQLSAEHILDQDPSLIFLADTKCCGQDAGTVAERPGWGSLTAVQGGAVVGLDDDVASRWGPRVVDFVEAIAAAVAALQNT